MGGQGMGTGIPAPRLFAQQGVLESLVGPGLCASSQVIMATNKIEALDPALIRPGRIDRKIEFPLPDIKTKRRIFGIHTVGTSTVPPS